MSHFNPPPDLVDQVARALAEDVGSGDLTAALVPAGRQGRATVITREAAVLCGRPWVDEVFRQVDPAVQVSWDADEGAAVEPGQRLGLIGGTGSHSRVLDLLYGLYGTQRLEAIDAREKMRRQKRPRPAGVKRAFREGKRRRAKTKSGRSRVRDE